ncbi:MAG: hypothetical protein CBC47_09535 [Alphaproteobacteria bacterium TMED87]|nr:hypothetical protein [Rhodospirillaceae bacterium]OUV07156.1 MAG: hypothetical protein CBC47_09535 [Alphaproteobacteria bacterium TMED87]
MATQEKIISLLDQAVKMHQANRLKEAENLYKKVLTLSPRQYDALNLLGVLAHQGGNNDQAIDLFDQAIAASPNLASAHFNKGNVLYGDKQLEESVNCYKTALTYDPQSQDALLNLGVILQEQEKTGEALSIFIKLIKIAPDNPKAHYNKGKCLHVTGNLEDAEKALKDALKLDPENADCCFALATVKDELNQNEEAIKYIQKAIKIKPDWAQAYSNLGNFQKNNGDLDQALLSYKKCLKIDPKNYTNQTNLGILQLYMGKFQEGWTNHGYRSKSEAPFYIKHNFDLPHWKGEDLSNENVLLWNEQGLGDEIIFCSMLEELSFKTKEITLLCSRKLKGVFEYSFSNLKNLKIIENRDFNIQPNNFNRAISLTDLGKFLRPSLNKFPPPKAYLKYDIKKQASLRTKLENDYGKNTKFIGISWASKNPIIGREKSIPIEEWMPLLLLPNIRFVNLQYGDKSDDLNDLPKRIRGKIISLEKINLNGSLDETLDLLSALDLLVTSSNTTAHLAGAAGLPVWILTPRGRSLMWYWFSSGNRSPWYKNAMIFRLTAGYKWRDLMSEISKMVTKLDLNDGFSL